MTRLEGELTDEKLAYLADERAMINETLSKQTYMQQSYMNDEISFEEYREYLSDYNYAYSRSELLSVIEKHADYLVRKEADEILLRRVCAAAALDKKRTAKDLLRKADLLRHDRGDFSGSDGSRGRDGYYRGI